MSQNLCWSTSLGKNLQLSDWSGMMGQQATLLLSFWGWWKKKEEIPIVQPVGFNCPAISPMPNSLPLLFPLPVYLSFWVNTNFYSFTRISAGCSKE